MTVYDKTNPLPDSQEPVVDRYRRWTPTWYRWIRPLLLTVKDTVSGLETLTTSVATQFTTVTTTLDAVKAQWGVTVNVNGRITGAVQLDGSPTESTFAVLADKFIIVHPTVDGTTIQAFVTGLVDGVPTVGVNGNLLVDGTILARSLDVDTLSAITADIGTCTAGVIRSSDSKFVIDLNNKTISITT